MHEIDAYVGKRIRSERLHADLTQAALADRVGIRFQQLQKYESGQNRVSASRLWSIAAALKVPVSSFFPDLWSDPDAGHFIEVRSVDNDILKKMRRLGPKEHASLLVLLDALATGD
ncbi:MAG: helix-turn-helix domain-containing protein [Limimaricola sp.]|uniref:helix-turn-helix domain-containing protein n=1 Tax=Limimaricola sp. TaxID=2211665 RepID=UPI001E000360|nr:helix-turn-helix transcriptional regulator [Limimaricola sp.]MBI1416854.1 helix-turn-helix domain-containing protein [Limimaricola sp.]